MRRFDRFVGIDWSGARGERHASIVVAVAGRGTAAPAIVSPPARHWSRTAVLDWLRDQRGDVLVGLDAGFGFAAIPGFDGPARSLWSDIDRICADDPDLGGHAFVVRHREIFWMGIADGPRAARAHLRVTERAYADSKQGQPTSNFVLLGASQVGKATLSAMRLLHRLDWPVWPFDPVPQTGPLILEIYAQAFAAMGGVRGKLRTRDALDAVLHHLRSAPMPTDFAPLFPDHVGDALVSAAGLRAIADQPAWWSPAALTPTIAAVEGWTFGIA